MVALTGSSPVVGVMLVIEMNMCVVMAADQQPNSSPKHLIKQLREKVAVHLAKPDSSQQLQKGCLVLQVAAAHGSTDRLPPASHCMTELDLARQVRNTSTSLKSHTTDCDEPRFDGQIGSRGKIDAMSVQAMSRVNLGHNSESGSHD